MKLRLAPESERQLDELGRWTGRTKRFYARELIGSNLEDLEDRYLAEARLAKCRPSLTGSHVRKAPGLEP